VDGTDADHSVLAFLRLGGPGTRPVLAILGFTPVVRASYAVGVPLAGRWTEVLNTDADAYGGSGVGNLGGLDATPEPCDGFAHRLTVTLPPLGCVIFVGPEAFDASQIVEATTREELTGGSR
jgi:1,4-alpha-glucan branching enzyme